MVEARREPRPERAKHQCGARGTCMYPRVLPWGTCVHTRAEFRLSRSAAARTGNWRRSGLNAARSGADGVRRQRARRRAGGAVESRTTSRAGSTRCS